MDVHKLLGKSAAAHPASAALLPGRPNLYMPLMLRKSPSLLHVYPSLWHHGVCESTAHTANHCSSAEQRRTAVDMSGTTYCNWEPVQLPDAVAGQVMTHAALHRCT